MKVAVVLIAAFLLLAPLALSSNRGFALGQEDDVEDVILEDEEDGAYGDFGSEGEDEDEAYESDGLIGSNEDIVTFVTFPDNQNLGIVPLCTPFFLPLLSCFSCFSLLNVYVC
eukprot:m.48124 g.48124  ORF g.48124 m.48124 type:complete len:113 (+) comp10814_c0_seq4:129-467(+)